MIRTVSSNRKGLQRALEEERDATVANDVGYRMLGKEVVLPMASIVELCKQAKSESDIARISYGTIWQNVPCNDHIFKLMFCMV